MKTGIIGAGSIGQLIFHDLRITPETEPLFIDTRLFPDTHPMTITLEYLRNSSNDKSCPPECYQGLITSVSDCGKLDLIVITTKAWQGKQVYQKLASYLPRHIPIILLMNGMGSFEEARKLLLNPLFSGITSRGAVHEGYKVYPRGDGAVFIGSPEHLTPEPEITLFARAVRGLLCDNIRELQLRKLLINACINPLTAIHQCRNAEVAEAFINETVALVNEIYPALKAQGLVLPQNSALDLVLSVARKTGNNFSSMAVDFQKHRPSELDYILGYILKTGNASGFELPLTANLYRTLKNQEKTFPHPESVKW